MSEVTYPIRVKATESFVNAFQRCECASYEDLRHAHERIANGEIKDDGYIKVSDHTFRILSKHKSDIVIENDAQLLEIYKDLGIGLISSSDSEIDVRHQKRARLIQQEIADDVHAVAGYRFLLTYRA